ncbi:hypothetical protein ATDW_09180 [Asticcacaulis sp. DW145]|jgi:hypothetical protein|uniref:hypothetical protein n=1 Tax=unclassified Asticcacaulis TaxID=2628350 RepID=UPI00308F5657|nr:hypothetical protein ATDW_09180 [Asticcacaulis sp. DW145]
MPVPNYQAVILLHRLRIRARRLRDVNQTAGNASIADIYALIDVWLEGQMAHAIAAKR